MKKYIFIVLAATFFTANAQNDYTDRDKFKVGINAALPLGDAANFSSFSLGFDVAYQYGVSKSFDIGLASGFTNAFGKTENFTDGTIEIETSFDNIQFLPLAGVFRFYPTVRSRVNFGADLGYAVGISEGNTGGFYYRPILVIDIGRGTEINFSYTGINLDGGSWETATLGLQFAF